MFEPQLDFKYDYRALPRVWRVTSLLLSVGIVAAVFFSTLATAAGIVA